MAGKPRAEWSDHAAIAARLQELYDEKKCFDPHFQIAKEFKVTPTTSERVANEYGIKFGGAAWHTTVRQAGINRINSLISTINWRTKIPTFNVSDCIISADWHIPFHNATLTERLLTIAADRKIETLFIIGDFNDCESLYHGITGYTSTSLSEELIAAHEILDILRTYFKRIVWLMGNHEIRIMKMLRRIAASDKGMDELLRALAAITSGKRLAPQENPGWDLFQRLYLKPGIEIYDVSIGYIKTQKTGKWMLVHPANYSRIPPQVERKLAVKYHANVIGTHGHLYADGMDDSGLFRCVQIGGMFDPDLLGYKHYRITTHPTMTPGFAVMQNSTPQILTMQPQVTDWSLWVK